VPIVVSPAASKSETILGTMKDKAEPGDIPVPENIGVSNKPHEVYTAPHRVGKLRTSVAFSENLGVKQALKFPRWLMHEGPVALNVVMP
jgi:hypothetical protein